MNRWLIRSTVPMALLIALGLLALIGTMVVPATTVETQYDSVTTVGAPASAPVVTVDHQGTALAIALLLVALGSSIGPMGAAGSGHRTYTGRRRSSVSRRPRRTGAAVGAGSQGAGAA